MQADLKKTLELGISMFAGELEGFANELIGTMAREGLL